MDKSEVFKMTIAELGFSPNTRNKLVELVLYEGDGNICFDRAFGSQKTRLALCNEWAPRLTVSQLIAAYTRKIARDACRHPFIPKADKQLADKLVSLGLTQLDWIALPPASISDELLRRLGPEAVRKLPVLVLGTLSHSALNFLERELQKEAPDITVSDFIQFPRMRVIDGVKSSVESTRQRLLRIGFGCDSEFFTKGARLGVREVCLQ
ncbi:MAG: hypothetical protein ACM3KM_01285 [Acidobacteriaceae bacterium]